MCEENKKPLETAELTDEQLEDVAGGAVLVVFNSPGIMREETKDVRKE